MSACRLLQRLHCITPVAQTLMRSLPQARARKAEMTTKLEELQRDIERLDQISDEQVATEEDAVRRLGEVRPSTACSPLLVVHRGGPGCCAWWPVCSPGAAQPHTCRHQGWIHAAWLQLGPAARQLAVQLPHAGLSALPCIQGSGWAAGGGGRRGAQGDPGDAHGCAGQRARQAARPAGGPGGGAGCQRGAAHGHARGD